jgi:hypothetical protein
MMRKPWRTTKESEERLEIEKVLLEYQVFAASADPRCIAAGFHKD